MTAADLVNDVFDKYYHNDFLPSKIGGSPETLIVRFLIAITNAIQVEQNKANISSNWIGNTVTWFTRDLPLLIQLPKFPLETDQQFLQRLIDFNAARELGGNSEATIKAAIASLLVLGGAINILDDITIITTSQFNNWKDIAEAGDAFWSQGFLWADTNETLRGTIRIDIQFANTGVDTDPLNYEYWNLPANFTKIQDVVKIFIVPSITFELQLLSP